MGSRLQLSFDTAKSTRARLRLDLSLHASCWRTKLAIRFAACRRGGKDSWVPVLRLDLMRLLLRLPRRGSASQPGGIITISRLQGDVHHVAIVADHRRFSDVILRVHVQADVARPSNALRGGEQEFRKPEAMTIG
jgi:hypothetical protein